MTLVTTDAAPLHIRTTAKQVFDVSGAGDTVVAVLAVMLGEGVALPAAAVAANLAAGIVVSKVGTATVTREEFATEMRRRHEESGRLKSPRWNRRPGGGALGPRRGSEWCLPTGASTFFIPGTSACCARQRRRATISSLV